MRSAVRGPIPPRRCYFRSGIARIAGKEKHIPSGLLGTGRAAAASSILLVLSVLFILRAGLLTGSPHAFGVAGYDPEIRPRRLVRLRAALLPVTQRTERDPIAGGKLLLGQAEGAA